MLPAPPQIQVDDYKINRSVENRNRLVMAYLPLGRAIVGRYMSLFNDPELFSVMNEAIVVAVHEFQFEHDNLGGYVAKTIHGHISNYLERRPLVHVPGRTQRSRRQLDREEVPTVTIVDVDLIDVPSTHHDFDGLEIDEIINRVCDNDQEVEVIRLRQVGYSDLEIGQQLSLSRWSVWAIRQGIQERYLHHVVDQR